MDSHSVQSSAADGIMQRHVSGFIPVRPVSVAPLDRQVIVMCGWPTSCFCAYQLMGCFFFRDIRNNAAVNTPVEVFVKTCFYISCTYSWTIGDSVFNIVRSYQAAFQSSWDIYIPIRSIRDFRFLYIFSNPCY